MLPIQLFVLLIVTLYHFTNCHPLNLSKSKVKNDANDDDDDGEIDLSYFGSSLFGVPSSETGDELTAAKWMNLTNPEEVGKYLEGDILVPKSSNLRNGMVNEFYRWPMGVIPFEIHGSFSEYFI